jgi:hypothetical protein
MKEKLNCIGKKILSKLLVLLGFSTTFVFMACYGPAPKGYQAVDFDEDSTVVDSLDTDSIVVEADEAGE